MKFFLFIIIALQANFVFAQKDSCNGRLNITQEKFSKTISKYEKIYADSEYFKLSECDKIVIIRLLNTILIHDKINSNNRYSTFFKNIQKDYLLKIINDLGAITESVETPLPHSRINFTKYKVYYSGCDTTNSAYYIIGLKSHLLCEALWKNNLRD